MHILDTASGRKLDLDHPQADQICLEDIAAALSKVCRFGAQPKQFYSVAQHAVHVSRMVEDGGRPDLALAALHHDSHEAYVCDLPSPVKDKLRDSSSHAYKELADALDVVIAEALGFPGSSSEDRQVIKCADQRALLIEARELLHDHGAGIAKEKDVDEASLRDLKKLDEPLLPDRARRAFMDAHQRLTQPSGETRSTQQRG